MKKRLLCLFVSVCLAFGTVAFAACGGSVKYDVLVTSGSGAGQYAENTYCAVMAEEASSGYEFAGWKVNGTIVSVNPYYTFKVTANTSIEATYKAITAAPAKYTVTVNGGDGSGEYEAGATCTVTCPDADEWYEFEGWKIGADIVSTNQTYSFTVSANTVIQAVYGYTPSKWDGTVPTEAPTTFVVDQEKETIDINDAAAFAWFFKHEIWGNTSGYQTLYSNKLNGNKSYVININCDIDLGAAEWKCVDDEQAVLDGCTINGNGHTILNMYTVAQKAVQDSTTYRGWGSGGFFSMVGGGQNLTMKNLTFKNAKVVGTTGQMGIVIGGIYNCTLTLDNVHVTDSSINDSTGHKVGGLIGRVGNCGLGTGDSEALTIQNCSVTNTQIIGMRNAGMLVGAIFSSAANRASFANDEVATQPGFAGLVGNEVIKGYEKYVHKLAWLEGSLSYMKKIVSGEIPATDATITVADAASKIPQWEAWIANEIAFRNADIMKNFVFKGNTSSGNTVITYATSAYNVSELFSYNGEMYDNTKSVIYSQYNGNNIVRNNVVANLGNYSAYHKYVDDKGATKSLYPMYPILPDALSTMFDNYVADIDNETETVLGETLRYDLLSIYVTVDLDFTALFNDNENYANIVLAKGTTFYLVNGAKIIGIPESVLQNVTFKTINTL